MLHVLLFAAITGFATYQPVTLATPVPRPATLPCRVTLFEKHAFVGDAPLLGSYVPKCAGPWARVILHVDTRIRGTQYDRTGGLWLDRAELLRFTTAEPTRHGIAYSVEKDVSAYSPLMRAPGSIVAELANYLNKQNDGIYYVDAYLDFYRASGDEKPAAAPDEIIPIDNELDAVPWNGSGRFTETLHGLPQNLVSAQLDLYASNHGCDEFWYTSVPDDYAAKHKADQLCGGGTYREIDVAIDGKPASVVYPFPYVWTGGINPLLWRPISAIDTLNVPAYRVDLDPWAGVLSDGKPHTITLSVLNDRGSWPMDANLMLWRDSRSTRNGGGIAIDTIAPPKIETRSELGAHGGNFAQSAASRWMIKGYVDSASGRTWHTIRATSQFKNAQFMDLPAGVEDARQREEYSVVTIGRDRFGMHERSVRVVQRVLADAAYPTLSAKSPFSLVISGKVNQLRATEVRPGNELCRFSVSGAGELERRKDGKPSVERADTTETNECRGPRPFRLWAKSHDGIVTDGNVEKSVGQ